MKLQLLFYVATAVVPVCASAGARGWEAVLFYDAYRMDGYRPENDRVIAKKCTGSAPGGRCNFIEFINAIDSLKLTGFDQEGDTSRQKITRLNMASIPASLDRINPDPVQAATIGDWQGRRTFEPNSNGATYSNYDGSYDSEKLAGQERLKHGEVMGRLGNIIEAGKEAAGDSNEARTILSRIDRVLDQTILARTRENELNLVREMNDHKTLGLPVHNNAIGEPKIVAYSKTITDAQGDRFEVLDTDRLFQDIHNHPSAPAKKKGKIDIAMTKFKDNYFSDAKFSENPASGGKSHMDTLIAVQAVSSKVKSLC